MSNTIGRNPSRGPMGATGIRVQCKECGATATRFGGSIVPERVLVEMPCHYCGGECQLLVELQVVV